MGSEGVDRFKNLLELINLLRGTSNKDFSTLEADVESILAKLDVTLSTRASESTLSDLLAEFQPVSTQGKVTAANNTGGLSVTLNKGGRRLVDVYYKLGGAGDLVIEVSNDGSTWRPYYSTSFSAAAEDIYSFETSYSYVRVSTPTTGIDVEFEITATR